MGSLFDGIGGFPLAAIRNGITSVWASEIEAFPIAVTKLRFPDMIHVGDITKLKGGELPPVDIICGGSPCQDLSVAGARAGLAGERSGLFMEQTRIVKEMPDPCRALLRMGKGGGQEGKVRHCAPKFRWIFLSGNLSDGSGEFGIHDLDPKRRGGYRVHPRPDAGDPAREAAGDWLNPKYHGEEILKAAITQMNYEAC